MNSHDDNEPLHPYIEPEIEARLTALVLGEASDFEREELDRLIGERPELGMLRSRLGAIHGLLREVASGEPDEGKGEWKLSDERRSALLAVIDGEAEPDEDVEPVVVMAEPKRGKKSRVAVLWQIAACLAIAAVLFGITMPASTRILKRAKRVEADQSWAFQEAEVRQSESARYGDFDNGMGDSLQGAFEYLPDEGNSQSLVSREVAVPESTTEINLPEVADKAETEVGFGMAGVDSLSVASVAKPMAIRPILPAEVTESLKSPSQNREYGIATDQKGVSLLSSLDVDGDDFMTVGDSRRKAGRVGALDGTVAAAAGGEILLGSANEGRVAVSNRESQVDAGAKDFSRDVSTEGAAVELKMPGNLYGSAISSSGTIRASGGASSGGEIQLDEDLAAVKLRESEPTQGTERVTTTKDALDRRRSGSLSASAGENGGTVSVGGGFTGSLAAISDGGYREVGQKSGTIAVGRDLFEIDLNAHAPEVAELDGFINYGSEITPSGEPMGGKSPEGASRYVSRLSEQVVKADEAAVRGQQLLSDGDLEGAVEELRTASELIPDAPITADRKGAYIEKLAEASTKLARMRAEEAQYGEAQALLEDVLAPGMDPNHFEAKKLLEQINDPEYYSPALTPEHLNRSKQVEIALRTAQGYVDLGDLDRAKEEYDKVLNADRYNSAARRGIEEVDQERLNYYETARNQMRSEFMRRVTEGWELSVPATSVDIKSGTDVTAESRPALGTEVRELARQNQEEALIESEPGVSGEAELGGTKWGIPMAGGDLDRDFERFQPAQQEWNEYPNGVAEDDSLAALKQIMDLVPHVVGGGNARGSSDTNPSSVWFDVATVSGPQSESQPTTPPTSPVFPVNPATSASFETRNVGRTAEMEMLGEPLGAEALTVGLRSGSSALDGDLIDELITDSKTQVEVGSRFGNTTINAEVSHFGLAGVFTDPQFVAVSRALGKDFRTALPAGLDETAAADESFSTFSLHVSDVAFKLAQASLAKGEWPDAERIRIEEFINAFDYGDPMPTQADRVACQVEQAIHPFLQQRNLLRVSMRTAAEGRAVSTPLRLTLLLDNSGSMERLDRQEIVRRAFATLAGQLQATDQVTLISFARQPRLLADAVSGAEANRLVESVAQLPSEGGTNLEAALKLAFEKAKEHQTGNAQNRIVLLTDGAANLGNAEPENLSRMIESMRQAGIAFDAAGIGAEGLNDEILEALTRKGDGRYYLLDRPEDVDDGFAKQIAGALRPAAKNVKVQVEFNPDRVGTYKLLGFEKHLLNKEDFRDDTVDAAEMAAAEAGVAVYQVEPKADGQGDIGSVSVRFLDLASGQMVEKRWPIPYVPNPARPEQAATSLRLATVAAQFAAKLKGGPLGDVVDLEELDRLTASLPESDQKSERVQQLREMIQQARQLEGSR